jgi:6-methylsalicylate decarboxylase
MADQSQDTALIDVHAHFLTDRYVQAAQAAGITQPDGMPMWPSWSVDDHLQLMDDTRVARAILSISSPGVHFGDDTAAAELGRQVNQVAADVTAEHHDRFAFFASLPLPCVDAAVAEAAYAMDTLGALGVVLMSNSAGVYLGDPALEPLCGRCWTGGAASCSCIRRRLRTSTRLPWAGRVRCWSSCSRPPVR